MRARVVVKIVAAAVLVPALAHASPLPEMIGAPGGSGGFNARVTGASPASTYFNPALLPDAHEDFGLGFYVLSGALDITLADRPAGADIGKSVNDGWQRDGNGIKPLDWRPLPTAHLSDRQGDGAGSGSDSFIGIGLVKQLLGPRLVLGMQFLLPAGKIQSQSTYYSDEREQYFGNSLHFEMLGDRMTLSTITFAVGGRLTPQLSFGVGASMGIATSVTTPVFVPDGGDYSFVFLDNDLSVSSKLSPHAGLIYRPLTNLTLAATVHAPSKVEVIGKNRIHVADTDPVDQTFTFVSGYEPLTVGAGAEWMLRDDGQGLGFVASGTWRHWATYEDRHGEKPLDEWKDTFSAALGARWVSDAFTVHLDGQYTPSPVPAQEGQTNYVDNDRVGAAAGISSDATFLGKRLRASLSLQGQRLLARTTSKSADAAHPVYDEFPDDAVNTQLQPLPEAQGFQSNNPGYPGYSSSGWLFGAGVSLETWF